MIKQERGRKTKGRKRRKRRLTLTPRKQNKVYKCECCPAKFGRDTQLKYHSKVHVDDQTEVGVQVQAHTQFELSVELERVV